MASKTQQQLERYKRKAAAAYAEKQATIRTIMNGVEVCAGSAASGYTAAKIGTFMGVPVDAAGALILLTAGVALGQEDVCSLGLGFAAGYSRSLGEKAGTGDAVINFDAFKVIK